MLMMYLEIKYLDSFFLYVINIFGFAYFINFTLYLKKNSC